ncbi:hypothetical protein NDI56_05215 [Haloarcula sp. S1CR25-12]|uniref:Uncharacterized protein n=1 Tax=Haloarcula saliterrae TaxID=2950534 RepID=A0ABU2F983_9EURY|nr:hypothetical protein [Haloarcula sp. S1CR25-12]MDS0258791.1 hypothetical protein [Haloarcula sp. S1CR25-12]
MSSDPSNGWTDPEYVATVVGVLAVGALVFYAELVSPTLTARTVVFVVLWVTLPMTVARTVARRWL